MSEIFRNRQPEVIKPVDAFPGVEDFQFPALKEHFAHSHNLIDAELLEQGVDAPVDQYPQGIEDAEVVSDTLVELPKASHLHDYPEIQAIGHAAIPDSKESIKNPYRQEAETAVGGKVDLKI